MDVSAHFFSLRCLTVVVGVEGSGGGLGCLPEQDPAADPRRQGGGQGSTAFRGAEPRAPRVVLVDVGVGGGALLRCEHVARAVSIGNMELFLELLFWHTLALVLATVYGGFRKNFLRFSA